MTERTGCRLPPRVVKQARGEPIDPSFKVELHFHPDLVVENTTTVIESLTRKKQYCSQFETQVTNGRPLKTGERVRWEEELFGDFYGEGDLDRPKYGALNYLSDSYGTAPRFGSCHLRLKADVIQRTTFCYPESAIGPQSFATAEHFDLMDQVKTKGTGMENPLCHYIEAHVHGPVNIPDDIEALVLDPSFQSTFVEEDALKLDCKIEWHRGYRAHMQTLREHKDFRGEETVRMAEEIADEEGVLVPALIATARTTGEYSTQDIKQVWQLLARFGRQTDWPTETLLG